MYQNMLSPLFICLLLGACSQSPVALTTQAVTEFSVNSTLDQPDVYVADDICDADPGSDVRCTLRAAAMQANVTPGLQTIRLQATVYRLSLPGSGEDTGLTGDIDLKDAVEVVGSSVGKARTVIDASGLGDRVLDAMGVAVTLSQLTVTGGANDAKEPYHGGGGIRNLGTLTLSDSLVSGNSSPFGGGVLNGTLSGTLTLKRTVIRNNSAPLPSSGPHESGGGGVANYGPAFVVRDSSIENNTSAARGGGILTFPNYGDTVKIERSLIAGNSAQLQGGGIYIQNSVDVGSFVLDNSTVSGNHSGISGGGIWGSGNGLTLELRAVTIAGNSAASGGGLASERATLYNVLLADNAGGNCALGSGTPLKIQYNLSSDPSCAFNPSYGNQTDTPAQIGPLAFNGGPTRTHVLLANSPAIDKGISLAPYSYDQRGALRIAEYRFGGNRHDIGALESNPLGSPR